MRDLPDQPDVRVFSGEELTLVVDSRALKMFVTDVGVS